MTHQPEKLNLWDRLFNRHRREVVERGVDTHEAYLNGRATGIERSFPWVDYRVVDRVTGSETVEREYLPNTL